MSKEAVSHELQTVRTMCNAIERIYVEYALPSMTLIEELNPTSVPAFCFGSLRQSSVYATIIKSDEGQMEHISSDLAPIAKSRL